VDYTDRAGTGREGLRRRQLAIGKAPSGLVPALETLARERVARGATVHSCLDASTTTLSGSAAPNPGSTWNPRCSCQPSEQALQLVVAERADWSLGVVAAGPAGRGRRRRARSPGGARRTRIRATVVGRTPACRAGRQGRPLPDGARGPPDGSEVGRSRGPVGGHVPLPRSAGPGAATRDRGGDLPKPSRRLRPVGRS
jgi:hypothetical protein